MAESGLFKEELRDFKKKNSENFETMVKTCLRWTKTKWEEEGETKTRLRKLINSLKFWRKKLKGAQSKTNVIITVFNMDKNVFVSLCQIFDAIRELDKDIKIVGYATFRNPRYISVTFQSEEIRDFVKSNLKTVDESNVAFLDWAEESDEHFIKILWLSDITDIMLSRNFVDKYFIVTFQNREEFTLLNGVVVPSGTVTFKGRIKKDINIKEIPHLAEIDGLECLVNISGRKCLCLCCEGLGHRAKDCPTPYCNKCKSLKMKKHVCETRKDKELTYADKVRGGFSEPELDELKDYNPETIIGNKEIKRITPLSNKPDRAVVRSGESEENKEIVLNSEWKGAKKKEGDRRCKELQETSSSGSSDSEQEDSVGGQLLNNLQNCFSELKKFNLPSGLREAKGSLIKDSGQSEEEETNKVMEFEETSLKRKLDYTDQPSIHKEGTSGRKTYSRKGRRNTAREKEEKKWNKIVEQSEM